MYIREYRASVLHLAYLIAVKLTQILKDYCKHLPSVKLPLLGVEQLV